MFKFIKRIFKDDRYKQGGEHDINPCRWCSYCNSIKKNTFDCNYLNKKVENVSECECFNLYTIQETVDKSKESKMMKENYILFKQEAEELKKRGIRYE